METPYFPSQLRQSPQLSKRQCKNFVILHGGVFEKKNGKVGENGFYNEQKQVKKIK
jgi:hypothetical protein